MGWPVGTGAVGCSAGPQPGTVALQAGILARFPSLTSLGIYNCRRVAGSTSWSLHAEGRAVDIGCSAEHAAELGNELLALLEAHSSALLVQRVIWNRAIYDAHTPSGRPYGGASPHTDHLHIEQTWEGARSVTSDTWSALQDHPDWMDTVSPEELKTIIREVLNEGSGPGQRTWSGTSAATLATVQGNHNALAGIRGALDALAER